MADKSKAPALMLGGDDNTPALGLETAHINHLRRLLAWLELEYGLDAPPAQTVTMLKEFVDLGIASEDKASEVLQDTINRYEHVPGYVRAAVKSLKKAIAAHEKQSGIVDAQ